MKEGIAASKPYECDEIIKKGYGITSHSIDSIIAMLVAEGKGIAHKPFQRHCLLCAKENRSIWV